MAAHDPAGLSDLQRRARAVAQLPEDHRVVVLLHYFAGVSMDEIAAFVDAPVGTVKSRLHAARRALRAGDLAVIHVAAEWGSVLVGLAFDGGGNRWVVGGAGVLAKFARTRLGAGGAPTASAHLEITG